MPLKVFQLEPGYKWKSTKIFPSLEIHDNKLRCRRDASEMIGDGFRSASSVYGTSEVDEKLLGIENKIEGLKTHFDSEIDVSLNEIKNQIISLKNDIINDKIFIQKVINSLIQNEDFLKNLSKKLKEKNNI